MVIKTKAPRWYQWIDGQIIPCYELKKKSGVGMKAYSLREARELKLLPSVTSVLSVIDKPELDNWRVSQAIHSALTLPRIPDEGEDAFAERVLADAEAQASKAAEFGTRIHDAIAKILNAGIVIDDVIRASDLWPYLEQFTIWARDNIETIHATEKCVGHPFLGVAGRMDLDCTLKNVGRCIVDFKTQAIKEGKPKFWNDWPIQLATYEQCCSVADRIDREIVSVIIPSNEPGPVHVKAWDDMWKYKELFHNALELWIYNKGAGYDPRQ